jgi:hypothetical protein
MMPTVSRVSVFIHMPAGGNSPKLGEPTTPQGRRQVTEPPVCVPMASGTEVGHAAASRWTNARGETGIVRVVVGRDDDWRIRS